MTGEGGHANEVHGNLVELFEKARALNTNVFSLVRLQLLFVLSQVEHDSLSFRDISVGLKINEGTLFSNLKVLEEMKYITSKREQFEGKEMEFYTITSSGKEQWNNIRNWLQEFIGWGRKNG